MQSKTKILYFIGRPAAINSLLINKTIIKKCKFGVVGTTKYLYRKREEENSTIDTNKIKKEHFNPRMKYYFKELIKKEEEDDKEE